MQFSNVLYTPFPADPCERILVNGQKIDPCGKNSFCDVNSNGARVCRGNFYNSEILQVINSLKINIVNRPEHHVHTL